MTLPGEIKPRSSEQCAGVSSGFVYTVRDRSHLSPSHHQHDPDLCVDDAMSSDLLFDDQLAQRTSGFECSFASGFGVNANSAMGKLCTGRRGSVAKTCSAMPCTRNSGVVANRAGLMATSLIKNRSDRVHSFAGTPGPSRQSVGLNGCVRQKTWRMRRHHELCPLSCIDRSQRSKSQNERKEEVTTISQRAAQIVTGAHTKEKEDVACPRCDRELYVFNTASGPILRCRGWTLVGTPCTLIKACHNGVIIPGGLQNTNRTEDGNSASGSGGPGTLPRRDDGIPNPHPLNDWTAQVQALAANPAWAQEQFAQWQLLHQQYQHLSISAAARGGVENRSLADPLGTGGVWTRERMRLVCNRPIQHYVRARKCESSTGRE